MVCKITFPIAFIKSIWASASLKMVCKNHDVKKRRKASFQGLKDGSEMQSITKGDAKDRKLYWGRVERGRGAEAGGGGGGSVNIRCKSGLYLTRWKFRGGVKMLIIHILFVHNVKGKSHQTQFFLVRLA